MTATKCALLKCAEKSVDFGAMNKTFPVRRQWIPGLFQVHFIHTGVCESLFIVFPDGTSMLLDCGDQAAITRGAHAVPVVPGPERLAGEWIARYVKRVNPHGADVDWAVISHFHQDHAGTPFWQKFPYVQAPFPGAPEEPVRISPQCARSGIGLAAEFLKFRFATDRGWPSYDDPLAIGAGEMSVVSRHVRSVWDALQRRDGLCVQHFRLGATDQFTPLHGEAPGFSVKNVCANGRIAMPDGSIRDLYADAIAEGSVKSPLNENSLSLGMVFTQGAFRFCTCGDFSDRFRRADGRSVFVEDFLGDAIGHVDVAKITHHGHHSVGERLARALSPRVWVAPVWDNLHCTDDSMESIFDSSKPDSEQPMLLTTVLPVRFDGARPWWKFVPDACRRHGCHVVLSVPPGGQSWEIELLDARDEEMRVCDRFEFGDRGAVSGA